MKLYSKDASPLEPVTHDPDLTKKVLFRSGVLPGIEHLSVIRLPAGSRASEHEHADDYEVFYATEGEVVFRVGGRDVTLSAGQCLVVEPGEPHSVLETNSEAELVYCRLKAPSAS
jgi:quercetin dioxygenase-like cupin family protein